MWTHSSSFIIVAPGQNIPKHISPSKIMDIPESINKKNRETKSVKHVLERVNGLILNSSVGDNFVMESLEVLDKECSALGGLFQQVVTDMKVRTNICHCHLDE